MCFNCFGRNHSALYCRCTTKCKDCGKSHHTLLHEASPEKRERPFMETNHAAASQVKTCATSPAHETVSNPIASASAQNTDCKVRLMVVPVRVYGDDNSSFTDTYCLLDSGSEISLCTKSLLQKLQVRGQPMTKTISGVNGMQAQHGDSVALTVRGAHETNAISVSNVFAIDDLPKVRDSIPRDAGVSMYEHLEGIRLAEVSSGQVELLIGAAPPAAHRVYETRSGFPNQPCGL